MYDEEVKMIIKRSDLFFLPIIFNLFAAPAVGLHKKPPRTAAPAVRLQPG